MQSCTYHPNTPAIMQQLTNSGPARLFAIIMWTAFLFVSVPTLAQNLPRYRVDSLLRSIKNPGSDSMQILANLELAKYQVFKGGEFTADLDSASAYLAAAIRLNNKFHSAYLQGKTLLFTSYLLREKNDRKGGRTAIEQAITTLEKIQSYDLLGYSFSELAQYYGLDDNEINQKITINKKALAAFEKSGNKMQQGAILQMLGDLYNYSGNLLLSLDVLDRALIIYKSIGHQGLQGIYDLMGVNKNELSNYKEAISYGYLALKAAEAYGDTTSQVATIYNRLGLHFFAAGDIEQAIKNFKSGMVYARRNHDINSFYFLATNTANAYVRQEKPRAAISFLDQMQKEFPPEDDYFAMRGLPHSYLNAYIALRDYDNALPYCKKLEALAGQRTNEMQNLLPQIINFYTTFNKIDLAVTHIRQFETLAKKNPGNLARLEVLEKMWYRIDSAKGNLGGALERLLAYNRIHDRLLKENRTKEIKAVELAYETSKSEAQIKLKDQSIQLLTQKAKVQEARFLGIRNAAIFTCSLLVLLGILGYLRYREKIRTASIIAEKNEQLQHLLKEKEWLLKEVHHRVKNNLHTVISLLESQSEYLENKEALKALEVSQHRIYAMSLIHQKLYQSEEIKTVNMGLYIPEFVSYLQDCFDVPGRIRFILDIESIEMGVNLAVPMALVLNEAVTNAIKYAFPQNRPGRITVTFREDETCYRFEVADNGTGLPEQFIHNHQKNPLGLNLIKGLSRDMHANLDFDLNGGTRIILNIPKSEAHLPDAYHTAQL